MTDEHTVELTLAPVTERRNAQFSVSQGAPTILSITDPDGGASSDHVVSVSIVRVQKTGTNPDGRPQFDIQLTFSITPLESK